MAKRSVRVREAPREKALTPVEEAALKRKQTIDRYYCRCRLCGFFMQRKFEGDDVCDAPRHKINEDEII